MALAVRPNDSKTHLDGEDLRAMFTCATRLLEANVEAINALNVFPVPDGDTGTNMFLTMSSVVESAEGVRGASAGEVVAAMAKGALMGARGNSGVILSQFFTGMAARLNGTREIDVGELADALATARQYAYKAVGNPVEGTVLTVIARVAEAADECARRGESVCQLLEAVCAAARIAVAESPTMLAVLRRAGVVDAGGHGLAVILEGTRRSAAGEALDVAEMPPPQTVGVDQSAGAVSVDFLDATEEELYGYCIQFMIEGEELNPDEIRGRVIELAGSTVVVGDETMVKVHAHTEDPGPLISLGASRGVLSQVKIDDMDRQRREFSVVRRQEASGASVAVVAVAWGSGLEALFTGLGASGIVRAGNTMNPSVQQILQAVDRAPADNVILLPNNGNIVPAARQALALTTKRLEVVPTTTIPQGIASILAYNVERDLAANVSAMEEAFSSVRTGEVTTASRSAAIGGVEVEKGQTIGLLEHRIVAVGDNAAAVLVSLLNAAKASDAGLVTLYWGERLTEDDARDAALQVNEQLAGVEVELVHGGQPHYHFIVSIE